MRPSASALLVLAVPAIAAADAIGPMPEPIACPPGAVSSVAHMMSHGQHAYCAPSLAPADAPCRPGSRREIRELAIGAIGPGGGGHGAPGIEATPENSLARVDGPCDAPDDAAAVALPPGTDDWFFGGPSLALVPVGCQRVWVWVADERVHCDAADPSGAPPSVEPAPATVAPSVEPPILEPPIAAPSVEPLRRDPVPTEAPSAEPASSCGCRATRRGAGVAVLAVLALVVVLAARR